ncbi:MAG: hypothetical protein K8I82_27605, partial [Anaerolineae bacterium]|nr:hypothetical protein [Anaerolineae bacterium]
MRQTPLLSLLCCLKCGGTLSLSGIEETADDGHILTGSLTCESCQQVYPIERGIPRFTSDHAARTVENTVKGFGYQWNRANQVVKQIDNREIFLDFIAPVQPEHFKDKLVLDGGCGQARFTALAEAFGAKGVIGADLSEAVEAAFANTRVSENILIIQADLFSLPLRPHFD